MGKDRKEEATWYDGGLRFTCTQCGNCCTGPPGYVWFSEEELAGISGKLGMDAEEVRQRYAHKVGRRWSLGEVKTEYGYDCVFLRRDEQGHGRCSIYEVRPSQCRTWPFWPENLKNRRAWAEAASRCPGMERGLMGEGQLYPVEAIRIQRDSTP